MADNSSGWEFSAGFFIGGLVGGLVGAAVAILMAPQAGQETRALLREKSIELRERADEMSVEARKRAEEAATLARQRAEQASADARERSLTMRESMKQTMDEKVAQVKDAIEIGKQAADKKKEEMMQNLQADKNQKPAM